MLAIEQKVKVVEGCKAPLSDDILNATQPLLLKGLVSDWPIVKAGRDSAQAAADYILKFYNGQALPAFMSASTNNGRLFYNADMSGFNFERVRGKLDELLAELLKRTELLDGTAASGKVPTCYVGSTNLDHWFPGLRQQNDLGLAVEAPLVSIWMGNQSRVAAHYDFPNNIACSVVGRRRFTLFPPEQLDNLYVGPLDFTPAGQAISLVDFDNPDFERFPKFRGALSAALVAELEPGDAVFVPSMWWHHVESLDSFNVLINYWWRNSPGHLGSPFDVLQHAMLGLKDLPREQRMAWKELFNHYVFDAEHKDFSHIPESRRALIDPISEVVAQGLRSRLVTNIKN